MTLSEGHQSACERVGEREHPARSSRHSAGASPHIGNMLK